MSGRRGKSAPATVERKTLTIKDAALYLGVGIQAMYELARTGKVKSLRNGVRYLFLPADLDVYLATAAATPVDDGAHERRPRRGSGGVR
jgi:excisionase family DNA binding protein